MSTGSSARTSHARVAYRVGEARRLCVALSGDTLRAEGSDVAALRAGLERRDGRSP